MRDCIISEIRRLAAEGGGRAPGVRAFTRATGITEKKWSGVVWARWGDALAEAGFTPNKWQSRFDSSELVSKVTELCRQLGRLPSEPEMRLQRKNDATFPDLTTLRNHFLTRADLVGALRDLAIASDTGELLAMLPINAKPLEPPRSAATDGSVYFLKSGSHYKIGRSDEIERRVKEVRVAQPEPVTLVHTIKTDDPPGIEAYWHRRFADRRANGEWFRLTADNVRAFTRRKFQ